MTVKDKNFLSNSIICSTIFPRSASYLWPCIVEAHITQTWSSSQLIACERTSHNDDAGFIATRCPSATVLSPFLTHVHGMQHYDSLADNIRVGSPKCACTQSKKDLQSGVSENRNRQFILCGCT